MRLRHANGAFHRWRRLRGSAPEYLWKAPRGQPVSRTRERRTRCLPSAGTGGEGDLDVLLLRATDDRHGHRVTHLVLVDVGDERLGRVDGLAVDGDDRVLGL